MLTPAANAFVLRVALDNSLPAVVVNTSTLVTPAKSASTTVEAFCVISNVSVPVPPANVSVEVISACAITKVSLPAPPVRLSTPAPAVSISAPSPPERVSPPAVPVKESSPEPPVIVAPVVMPAMTVRLPVNELASTVATSASKALVIVKSASPATVRFEVSTPDVLSVPMVLAKLVDVMAKVSSSLVVPPASVIVTLAATLLTVRF